MIRIVIYDDNLQRRESLKALLSLTDGMECVASFPDCSHVKEDMVEFYPDVVLMDIAMPNVDGISGVGIIKKTFPEIRIIMQTVFEDEEKIFASLQAGAEGYILKNASAEKITQCIEEVYHGGAYMTPSVAIRVMNYFNKPLKQKDEYKLTPKEKEVLKYLSDGLSYKMVADKLGISYFTVNAHIKKIYEKLHVHSLGEAVSMAIKNRIV
ncbi:MAG TPA: response regulator transcription factor [Chitinophagaceae bacterium]|nr:response regulator transcription factor [Chitinophagaceae bacterium]